jgi:hypothetical protein
VNAIRADMPAVLSDLRRDWLEDFAARAAMAEMRAWAAMARLRERKRYAAMAAAMLGRELRDK